jgi:hypothetical protein|tara:strand:+ start:259 stop:702 length:444 start_codon:yes stop_codon:yes gene_type:complete
MTDNESLRDYFEEYCGKVDITLNQLYSKSRKRDLVEKRMVLMYTLRKSVGMTLHKIADALDKNHATIIHAVKSIEDFIVVYPHIQKYYDLADECLVNHKENLIEYYRSPIFTEIERNRALVDILIDNNSKLKSKIKKLKKELHGDEK